MNTLEGFLFGKCSRCGLELDDIGKDGLCTACRMG